MHLSEYRKGEKNVVFVINKYISIFFSSIKVFFFFFFRYIGHVIFISIHDYVIRTFEEIISCKLFCILCFLNRYKYENLFRNFQYYTMNGVGIRDTSANEDFTGMAFLRSFIGLRRLSSLLLTVLWNVSLQLEGFPSSILCCLKDSAMHFSL